MKTLFAIVTAWMFFFQTSSLETLREVYPNANASKQNSDKFSSLVEKATGNDAAIRGYKAAAQIIRAKFEKGESRKTHITQGIKSLESAVNSNPKNVELRVIRLSVQENLPKIIGYNRKMKEDKMMILNNYAGQNSEMKQYIKHFSVVSKSMTPAEKSSLK